MKAFFDYIRNLRSRYIPGDVMSIAKKETAEAQFVDGYRDHLQIPLQPLKDNLESFVYETFEKDPVKYAQYEEALRRALIDILPSKCSNESGLPVNGPFFDQVRITVLGAGRGPLVEHNLTPA